MVMRWIFAFFLVSVGIYLVRSNSMRNIAMRRLAFLAFIFLGITSLIFRDSWTNLSQKLGVESGTALLTYLVTFAFISYVITSYRWKREYEQKLTLLSREIALKDLDKEQQN